MGARLPILGDREDVDAAGARWRRSGDCNRCGECCRSGDPFGGERGRAAVEGACPLYAVDADGKGLCADRSEANGYYTRGCASWPSLPAHIGDYPSCSYTFKRVE